MLTRAYKTYVRPDVEHNSVIWSPTSIRKIEEIERIQRQFTETRGQSNLTKSASRGAHSPVRGHPRGSKFVPLNSWSRVSY